MRAPAPVILAQAAARLQDCIRAPVMFFAVLQEDRWLPGPV
ncbi:hypothetical protein [Streptomyces sioyaensis]